LSANLLIFAEKDIQMVCLKVQNILNRKTFETLKKLLNQHNSKVVKGIK